jgi:hypothetical protein
MASLVPCGSEAGLTVTCATATPDHTTSTTNAPAAAAAHRRPWARATSATVVTRPILPYLFAYCTVSLKLTSG